MPESPPAPSAVAAPTKAGPSTLARAPSQPVPPLLPGVKSPPFASRRRKHRRQTTLASVGPENRPQETTQDGYDFVHADCKFIFEKAERDRSQLMAQLKKASDAARKVNTEKVQSNSQLRKLNSELNESRKKNVDLEQRLEESTVDHQMYILLEEHKRILEEVGKVSSYVSRTVESKRNECQSFYLSGAMSTSDAEESSWKQAEQFRPLHNPVVPYNMESMPPESNDLAGLPEFNTFNTVPSDVISLDLDSML